MVYLDTYQPLVVILLYTIRYVHSGIDKENDMEGLITDSQIETHEIPLKYDLFRERILPEFLQTVGEEGLAEYVDKVSSPLLQSSKSIQIVQKISYIFSSLKSLV